MEVFKFDFKYDAAFGVSLCEITSSADLGGSSKYSKENFED